MRLKAVSKQGKVSRHNRDFNANNEYDYIANYKVLQAGFNKLNIDKVAAQVVCAQCCSELLLVCCSLRADCQGMGCSLWMCTS